jgi:hypothetical protein
MWEGLSRLATEANPKRDDEKATRFALVARARGSSALRRSWRVRLLISTFPKYSFEHQELLAAAVDVGREFPLRRVAHD